MKRNRLHHNLIFWALASGLLLVGLPLVLFAHRLTAARGQQPGSSKAEKAPWKASDSSLTGDNHPGAPLNATLTDFAWLEGKWQGSWGPRAAEQLWTGPKAGEMLGLFRVVENDKTLVVELYSLLETSDGIELRLRHFTASLLPWEQSSTTLLKLASLDPNAAVFENPSSQQPRRLTLLRVDPETYVSRSEITSGDDNRQVTEIRYHKQKSAAEVAPLPKKRK
jgi:hypothetical protein